MTDSITITITDAANEPMLDGAAMSLLFGVDVEAVRALPMNGGTSPIPREWVKRGRRRASEARAATGSDFILDSLNYWAGRDHGAELEVIYE